MSQIVYTGTFKVIKQIVDWINNYTPSGDSQFEEGEYVDINGDTVIALFQKED